MGENQDEFEAARERQIRDERIKKQLLSASEGRRKEGLLELDANFRSVVASILQTIAQRRRSAAFDALLVEDSDTLNRDVFADIWSETVKSVWGNVQRDKFKAKGSLLAYLVTIAVRRTFDRYRRQRRYDDDSDLDWVAVSTDCEAMEVEEKFFAAVDKYVESLSVEDRMAMKEYIHISVENGSPRGILKELVKRLNEKRREQGLEVKSESAIKKHNQRLREELRDSLKRQGYNV